MKSRPVTFAKLLALLVFECRNTVGETRSTDRHLWPMCGGTRSTSHLQSIPDGLFRQTISSSDTGPRAPALDTGLSPRELDVEA